jgi:hypothetical protein
MKTKEEVGTNLKECFGADIATQERFDDWCKVGSFLSDSSKVFPQMQAIASAMYDRLSKKRLATKVDSVADKAMVTSAYHDFYKSYKPGTPKPKIATDKFELDKAAMTHLLSEVLSKFEKTKGFDFQQGDFQTVEPDILKDRTTPAKTGKHVATYHGFVKPENFNKQLVKRSHWKDPGALLIHGEFTHRIQWYAIAGALFTGVGEAAAVFESIGKYAGSYERKLAADSYLYLWDALCDRTNVDDVSFDDEPFRSEGAPGRSKDFRSPENLNAFLCANEGEGGSRWPLLRDFLRARYSKREFQVNQAVQDARQYLGDETKWPSAFQAQYLCRKLYNVSYWSLKEDDPKYLNLGKLMGDKSDQIVKL